MADYLEDLSTKYEHPCIRVIVQDNTIRRRDPETVPEAKDFNGIQVGFFPDGRDNVMLYYTSTDQAINELGSPNHKTYGQALYNVVNALDTKNCGMYVMNLKPADATIANAVLMVKARVETNGVVEVPGESTDGISLLSTRATTKEIATPKLHISFERKTIEGATTEAELSAKIAELYTDIDDEGNFCVPLLTYWSIPKGRCGNNTRIRMLDSTDYDFNASYHQYKVQVIKPTEIGLAIIESKDVVFDENGKDNSKVDNPSVFIESVINDPEYGSSKVCVAFDVESYEAILSMYNSVHPESEKTTSTFDILFGKLLSGIDDPNIVINDDGTCQGLFTVDGMRLEGGTDGSLEGPNAEEVKKQLLIDAYNGNIDERIKSRFSTPADFNLDAGYDDDVKRAMAGLAILREYDCMTYLDSGLLTTNAEIINWGKNMNEVVGYNVIKESGCFKYRDLNYTGKIIPLTITHFLAKAIPNHMAIYGLTEPFAKELARLSAKPIASNARISSAAQATPPDFVKGTFRPEISPDNNDIKAEYRKYGINCYETVDYYTVQRADGITTCREMSDRQLEFNEYIFHGAIKIAYELLDSKIFKIGEPEDRARYEKHADAEIKHKFGNLINNVEVKFIVTAKDAKRRLMRLQMTLEFKNVITGGAVIAILEPNSSYETAAVTTAS